MLTVAMLAIVLRTQEPQSLSGQLARPVTFAVSMSSLGDVAAQLSKDTGVPLSVNRSIIDRKVTLACKGLPASEVMKALAEALGLEWRQQKAGLELVLSDHVRSLERQAELEEQNARLSALSGRLDELVSLSRLSKADRTQRVWAASAEAHKLDPLTDEGAAAFERLALAAVGDEWVAFGASIAGKTSELASTLATGEPLFATNPPMPGVFGLPSGFINVGSPQASEDAQAISVIRFDDDMPLSLWVSSMQGQRISLMRASLPMPSPPASAASGLRAYLDRWAAVHDDSVLAKPLRPSTERLTGPYLGDYLSTGDQLLDLSERSGVPVVADAFRLPCSQSAAFQTATVKDWVSAFSKRRKVSWYTFVPGYVRSSDGWLMFRNDRYWAKLPLEAPESALGPLEASLAHGGPTLDDYADFASKITARQLKGAQRLVLLRCHRDPLASAPDALRLWGSLSVDQRRDARGEGLLIASLDEAQRQLMLDMIANLIAAGQRDGHLIDFTRAMLRGEDQSTTRIVCRPEVMDAGTTLGSPQSQRDAESMAVLEAARHPGMVLSLCQGDTVCGRIIVKVTPS